jgi:hypothetical protein
MRRDPPRLYVPAQPRGVSYEPGLLARTIEPRIRQAIVCILDGPTGVDVSQRENASGTLFRTPLGKIVVLTAAHVVEERPKDGLSIVVPGRSLQNSIGQHWRHPDGDVDVALAHVTPETAAIVGHRAHAADVVASADDWRVDQTDSAVLCGFPGSYRSVSVDVGGRADHSFVCMAYDTVVEANLDPAGRYQLWWNSAIGVEETGVSQLRHPGGVSGGALWRVRHLADNEVWVPDVVAKIVGVADAFLARKELEFAPSVLRWADWFRQQLAAIDADAAIP